MSRRVSLLVIVFCDLFAPLGALAEDRPAQQEMTRIKEATALDLAQALDACSRKRIYYRMLIDPFTKKPIHSFEVRTRVDDFPVIPFAYELSILRPLPSEDPESYPALDAFKATRPISGVRLALDTTSPRMDWKKLRGVSSLTFDYGSRWNSRDLARLESLTTLVGPFDDSDLKELKQLKHLKNLYTTGRVTNTGLKELSEFPALEHLILGNAYKMTHEGIKHLQDAKKLTHLAIANPSSFDTRAIMAIAKTAQLTHLELSNFNARVDLSPLGDLESLVYLELRDPRLRGDQRLSFEKCKSLQTLVLEGSWVDASWIKNISKIDSLKSLTLEKTQLTDEDLGPLHALHLHTLILSGPALSRQAHLTGEGLGGIVKGMKSLTVLGIEGMPLFPIGVSKPNSSPFGGFSEKEKDRPSRADKEAARKKRAEIDTAFRSLTQLRCLKLIRAGVSEEEVDWLKDLKGLQYLYLDGKAHKAVAGNLRTALPRCTIVQSSSRPVHLGMEPAK